MRDFFTRYDHHILPVPFSGCWIWTGAATPGKWLAGVGYGSLTRDRKRYYAHRCAYEAVHGDGSAAGLVVRHTCDLPLCVNPDHLLIGTIADNSRDAVERDRVAHGERAGSSKLTETNARVVRTLGRFMPQRMVGSFFGINQQAVSLISRGKRWRRIMPAPMNEARHAFERSPLTRSTKQNRWNASCVIGSMRAIEDIGELPVLKRLLQQNVERFSQLSRG